MQSLKIKNTLKVYPFLFLKPPANEIMYPNPRKSIKINLNDLFWNSAKAKYKTLQNQIIDTNKNSKNINILIGSSSLRRKFFVINSSLNLFL